MPTQPPLRVDWGRIRALWEQGATPEAISAQFGGKPTARGIKVISTRERWVKASDVDLAGKVKATPDARAAVIQTLREGGTYMMAAAMAGVTKATLTAWRKDEAFQIACDRAIAEFATGQVKRIHRAGSDDWKASSFLLTHHPETRKEFAPAVQAGGGGLHITLNIPRASENPGNLIEGEVSEGQLLEHDQ